MWIFTSQGFFSVVEDSPDRLVVRSRTREDLERLVELTRLTTTHPGFPIEATPDRDYPWRFHCTRETWAWILWVLGERIDYPNFKDEVYRTLGAERETVLHTIWTVLRQASLAEGPVAAW
jgi:hypothetical protein